MSRELKLALILGFAAVMVVGVLISDHMSGARQARIEERTIEPPRLAMQPAPQQFASQSISSPGPVFIPDPSEATQVASAPIQDDGPAPSEPVVITMAPQPVEPASRTLATTTGDSVREFLDWTARQGVVFEQVTPLAETTTRARPSGGSPSGAATGQQVTASPAPVVAPQQSRGRDVEHIVARNETLWGIAQRYYGDGSLHTRISEANRGRLGRDGALFVGARLTIPGATRGVESQPAATASNTRPRTQAANAPATTTPAAAPTQSAPQRSSPGERVHVVQKGETLGAIAAKELGSARRWPEIARLNRIEDPDNVPAGVRLRLPPR